jgi:hypothetical protein
MKMIKTILIISLVATLALAIQIEPEDDFEEMMDRPNKP